MKWKPLQMPKRVEVEEKTMTDRFGRFFIEPLERGFGMTIGNSLRRVLLSSLQGAAVTAVRIDGVLHEFTTINGVFEDTTQVIMNLKKIRFKFDAEGPVKGHIEKRGKGELRAGDLEVDPSVTVLNPELHIATLNDEAELVVDVEIAPGRGYVVSDLPLLLAFGVAAAYCSVLVLALYLFSQAQAEYSRPQVLWLLCPVFLYWVSRVWLKTHRRQLHEDPVVFALTDWPSRFVALACVAIIWFAT